ncbi:protein PHOSPHATE-INDUCED 1-like [Benincasa hispida]|uniref:protein PHOSPHATE-INDUCED 1-like n=1 Tax=Benincasa hispida TaxID=102211 RepID=UPI0018FFC6AF|nr:protein PHOSPHATE-INDUCED 1-like [Benincasa hispida]
MSSITLSLLLLLSSSVHSISATATVVAARNLAFTDQPLDLDSFPFEYHGGPLLSGNITINLIWYGNFIPSQKSIVTDFINSVSSSSKSTVSPHPSVSTWWNAINKFYNLAKKSHRVSLSLGSQILDPKYSLGKSLTDRHILSLASRGRHKYAINVVLTAADVTIDGFCFNKCGSHGISVGAPIKGKRYKFEYIWVGNSATQCPGQCAWPFHRPVYGPQNPPLVPPNKDVGMDGIIINLASLLAGTATNPFGNGFYQGSKEAPLEAASACTGIFGKGAFPGYPGELLVDRTTGASYNANGGNGRKYLLPALFNPITSTCSTLV